MRYDRTNVMLIVLIRKILKPTCFHLSISCLLQNGFKTSSLTNKYLNIKFTTKKYRRFLTVNYQKDTLDA